MTHVVETSRLGAQHDSRSATSRGLFIAREAAIVLLGLLAYRKARLVTRDHTDEAVSNAWRVMDLERALGIYNERTVQELAMHSRTFVGFLNRYYVGVHFAMTGCFIAWVIIRHPEVYARIRFWFLSITVGALAIHILFPLMPPRLMRGQGFIDTLQVYGPTVYGHDLRRSVANQIAAMPSLHFGWAFLVAAGFVMIKRNRWSILAFVHPLITLLAIVATANHYWMDAIVALLLAIVVIAAAAWWSRRSPSGRRSRITDEELESVLDEGTQPAERLAMAAARSDE